MLYWSRQWKPLAIALSQVFIAALLYIGFTGELYAATPEGEEAPRERTRRTPAMRETVYQQLSEAQTLGEEDKFQEALSVLNRLRDRGGLNSYEAAQMWNFYAFIYYAMGDFPQSIKAYENVIAQPNLPEAMETGAIYSLGQLYFLTENYVKAIEMLEDWFAQASNPGPEPYVLLSQAYYQQKDYRKALPPLDKGIQIARQQGKQIRENWLLLKRVYHFELEQPNEVIAVLKELIKLYPRKEYWKQLAGVYGQLNQRDRQLAIMDLAYGQGFLDRSQDLVNLAQLFMLNDIPYRAAQILESATRQGIVESNLRNLRLLSQAWTKAQEDEKALPILGQAARLSSDGELDLNLAYAYMNLDEFDKAAEAARNALEKGGLRRPDDVRILLGTALFNADQLEQAKSAFRTARNDERSRNAAAQWIAHIDKEQQRRKMLSEALQ